MPISELTLYSGLGFKDRLGGESPFPDSFPRSRRTKRFKAEKRCRPSRRAADLRLPHEVKTGLSRYGHHPSDWELITGDEAHYNLRADAHIRLFIETARGWQPLKALNGKPGGLRVLAFRRHKAAKAGCSTTTHQPRTKPLQLPPGKLLHLSGSAEPEPSVHILQPANDAVIEPDHSPLGRRHVEWYTFQPGDTVVSVTRRHLGYADPERVYDAEMRSLADPQPGDRCRVFMGHLLRLEGRVANAAQVHIAWQGPTQGIRTLAGSPAGSGYWRTEIPIKPGHYQFTARLDEGPQARTDFDVVESAGNRMARLRGMAKELVNRVVAEQQAVRAEWFAAKGMNHYRDIESGRELTPEEVAERYRAESPPQLELESPAQEAGAQTLRDLPQTPALIAAITALSSRGRSLLRDPDEFLDDMKRALTHSRSETEALGELGMRQAHRRLGVETDPRYVNRYHGPDDIGHQNKRLTETEAKGSRNDQVRVAEDSNRNRQGSPKKNRRRAEAMKRKERQGKVGQPSSRQGGAYTEGEMALWNDIFEDEGDKQHILVHTNTTTGVVRTFEQVDGGKIGKKLDEFKLENFEEAKTAIKEFFKK